MPYMLSEDGLCVHKKNSDNSLGEEVKCHDTKAKAKAHLMALSMNVEDAAKYAKEFVPNYKAVTDAKNLRGQTQQHCGNCNFYKYMPTSAISGYYEMESEQGICNKYAFLTNYEWVCDSWKEFTLQEVAMKAAARFGAIKVAGDWELLVNGNPFGPDSDSQWFDANTKLVTGSDIPVVYYHSLEDTKNGPAFANTPVVIGKASDPQVKFDGVWWKVVLDKTVEQAKLVWDAAKKGLAVASSGAIDYLSRLEVGGKSIPYDKSKPGRISVWHMGELSLWDYGSGHLKQAHPHAVAVPALKAIYEAASLPLPPSLVSPRNAAKASKEEALRKGELEKLLKSADEILNFIEYLEN